MHVHCIYSCTYANYYLALQSDPFVEIGKVQEGGSFTVVYRSQPILKTLDPKYVNTYTPSRIHNTESL